MKRLFLLSTALLFCAISFAQESNDILPANLTREEVDNAIRDGYQYPIPDRGITTPPPFTNVRAAAEWEEIQALCIAWTSYPGILKQIVAAAVNECEVIICSENPASTESYLLNSSYGGPVDLTNVTILNEQLNSVWMRDYGPNTVYGNEVDDLYIVDWIYNRPRPDDDVLPDAIGAYLGVDVYNTTVSPNDLMNTGGNYMTDGFGQAFCSELVLDENQGGSAGWTTYPNHTEAEINSIMNQYMGIDEYIKMPTLPYDGIHHIDMHMKLLDEETLLVAEYPAGTADGPQIEANINYVLNNFTTKWGTPYNVVRIPSPPQQSNGNYPPSGWYLTYTNSVFINNTVLVPTYYSPYDEAALDLYAELLPGYNIVGIDCDNSPEAIISASGAIHCITNSVGVSDPMLISYACLPNTNDDVNDYYLQAYINHTSGISGATLYYKTNLVDPYTAVAMTDLGSNEWGASIPAQAYGTDVYYYVEGVSNSGKVQTKPMPAPVGYKHFQIINEIFGCTDSSACNYDSVATVDDNTCILPDGCTDSAACNYNSNAQCDDGSCIIGVNYNLELSTDCWGSEVSWELNNDSGTTIMNGGGYGNQNTYNENLCVADGCYDFVISDSFGDGMDGTASGCAVDGNYIVTDNQGNIVFQMGDPDYGTEISHNFCVDLVNPGCTDTSACNYDSLATEDDGSCLFGSGCTDSTACNFDSNAGCDDGSCEYLSCAGCTNSLACNYDSTATIDDGSCNLPDGCTDSAACNYAAGSLCDDGSCEYVSCVGCTDSGACNFDSTATIEDGTCEYITCLGCTNALACNYDSTATIDDGNCILPDGCTDSTACNYDSTALCDDGECFYFTCEGCTNSAACNYDSTASQDNGTCILPSTYYQDSDGDGYGNIEVMQDLCAPQTGWSTDATDCDDTNAQVFPGAPGTNEGFDNDCSGEIDPDEVFFNGCLGDFNNDGIINTADLLFLLGDFGCMSNCVADMNDDGVVSTPDLLEFLGVFGQPCP